jgi:prolyl-tRNA editing enzyme YbaK/EbsC (Cys-tRNA(Pro) deacylase)
MPARLRCRLAGVDSYSPAIINVLDAAARKGVELRVVTFGQSTHTAQDAAQALGAELGQIVKSLVFVAPGTDGPEPCLALVSGSNTVDLERLSAVLSEPRIRRATADEARQLTGFPIGGIPPFGHRRLLRTVMDPDLGRYQTVWAAAGTPNAVFELPPGTLRMLSNAVVAPLARETVAAEPRDTPTVQTGNEEAAGARSLG